MELLRRKQPREGVVFRLPVEDISPNPYQPRAAFSQAELSELADSIRQFGILQPLSVRNTGTGYQLIAGERRLRAAKLAGLSSVPCLLVSADDERSSLLALMENLQRQDLSWREEAQAISRLVLEFRLSQEDAARRLGKSQSAVANKLRLLRISPSQLDFMEEHGLTERHARALLRLEGEEPRRRALEYIVLHHLNVAQTERYLDGLTASAREEAPPRRCTPAYRFRDVRLFLNTVQHALTVMNAAGVPARCRQEEQGDELVVTIRIPKKEENPKKVQIQ